MHAEHPIGSGGDPQIAPRGGKSEDELKRSETRFHSQHSASSLTDILSPWSGG